MQLYYPYTHKVNDISLWWMSSFYMPWKEVKNLQVIFKEGRWGTIGLEASYVLVVYVLGCQLCIATLDIDIHPACWVSGLKNSGKCPMGEFFSQDSNEIAVLAAAGARSLQHSSWWFPTSFIFMANWATDLIWHRRKDEVVLCTCCWQIFIIAVHNLHLFQCTSFFSSLVEFLFHTVLEL